MSTTFIEQLRQPWDKAQGFLIQQLSLLAAKLSTVYPLTDSLATTVDRVEDVGSRGYSTRALLGTDADGVPGFSKGLPGPLALRQPAVVTCVALTANTDDYRPAGLDNAGVLRISSTMAISLTGIVPSPLPTFRLLQNTGSFTITLKHQDAGSPSYSRFTCPNTANISLTTKRAAWIWYDTIATTWQVIG